MVRPFAKRSAVNIPAPAQIHSASNINLPRGPAADHVDPGGPRNDFGFLICGHDVRRAAKNTAIKGFAELGDGANAICRIITAVVAVFAASFK